MFIVFKFQTNEKKKCDVIISVSECLQNSPKKSIRSDKFTNYILIYLYSFIYVYLTVRKMPFLIRSSIFLLILFTIQELKESFNYGLFCPPSNGKAGKFLDEERRLGDYPFNGPVGYLEVSLHKLLFVCFCPSISDKHSLSRTFVN